jgi:hypothetical protein
MVPNNANVFSMPAEIETLEEVILVVVQLSIIVNNLSAKVTELTELTVQLRDQSII